jgi:hypothetical protein
MRRWLTMVAFVVPCIVLPGVALADEVLLVDGGRVRGSVIEESPKDGVKILLENGTTYVVPAAQVKEVHYGTAKSTNPTPTPPVAPPRPAPRKGSARPMATVSVSIAEGAGKVFVTDNYSARELRQPKGRVVAGAPMTLQLAEGEWEVEVEFDDGGAASETLYADAKTPSELRLSSWLQSHRGVHLGIMGYMQAGYLYRGVIGPRIDVFADLALAPACDLRLGGAVGMFLFPDPRSSDTSIAAELSAVAHFVFNVPGGVYRPYVGASGGVVLGDIGSQSTEYDFFPPKPASPVTVKVHAELSLLHFSFGSKRSFDLDFSAGGGMAYLTARDDVVPSVLGRIGFGGVLY